MGYSGFCLQTARFYETLYIMDVIVYDLASVSTSNI